MDSLDELVTTIRAISFVLTNALPSGPSGIHDPVKCFIESRAAYRLYKYSTFHNGIIMLPDSGRRAA
jgi:hypothetical protein